MSYQNDGLSRCKDLQRTLQEVWGTSVSRVESLPLLSALSDMAQPLQPVLSPGGGKVRKLETVIFPRELESSVTEASSRVCTAETKVDEHLFEYEIDPNDLLQTEFYFEADDFNEYCLSNADFLNRTIANKIEVLRRAAATKIAGEVALMPGNWGSDVAVDGNNALVVATKHNVAGDPAVDTLQKIDFATRMQTMYAGPYIVAGGADLYNYIELVRSGCCYNGGIDIGEIYDRFGMAAIYDKRLATELNGTGADSLAIDMNTIQLVNYVQAPWRDGMPYLEPRIIGGNGWGFVFSDTVSGLLFDVRMKHDCGRVDVVIDTVITAKSLPNNMFKEGDEFYGVNWINKLKVTNPSA